MNRRNRGAAMLGLAGVCAGLAATSVDRYADDVAAQVGPLRKVVVARRAVPRGTFVTAKVARAAFEQRRVPSRFVPPRSLGAPREAVGYRTLATMSAGDYVGATHLGAPRSAMRRRDAQVGRLVAVAVTGAHTIAPLLRPGTLVDVLVTTDTQSGSPRTYLALQRLELVEFAGSPPEGAQDGADATATLRTTLRQAATLTAAQNFAREVRVVPRPRGDVRRLGPTSVTATGLAP